MKKIIIPVMLLMLIACNSGDNKSAVILTGSDRTSAKFSFNSDEGKKKKFIGVVVK